MKSLRHFCLAVMAVVLTACAGNQVAGRDGQITNNSGIPVTQQTSDAADRTSVMMSEQLGASKYKLSIGTSIRADRTEAEATNAARGPELAQEAARIAQANGATGYVVVDDHTLVKTRVRKVLQASASEPNALVREWTIEIGNASVPRSDGRPWIKVP